MLGFLALIGALITTIIAVFMYVIAAVPKEENEPRNNRADLFYGISVGLLLLASLYLYYLILDDQFQYRYIFGYSSSDLSVFYKISVFWAGQEGSFLLWVLLHGVFGYFLKRSLSEDVAARPAIMGVYGLLQTGLLILLMFQNPFILLPQTPIDGTGLNPLLMNPWMIAHPPVLFVGYAALAVPFALALGSLTGRDLTGWMRPALKWALFGWAALGMGIFMGGFWAYEVLGWGGYWAWDPVENSSLIPWLIAAAMVHFLLAGLRQPGIAYKPALLAVVFAYATTLYGTFLTRSGFLSDFSTHSFQNQGLGTALGMLVLAVIAFGLILLIVRWPHSDEVGLTDGESLFTRGFMATAGAFVLCTLALVVAFGTSYPLITMMMGHPQGVATSFYNITALPLAACLFLLLIPAGFLHWQEKDRPFTPKETGGIVVVGASMASLGLAWGVGGNLLAIVVLALAGAALAATIVGLKRGMSKPSTLTHVGFACLIIGVIISSVGAQNETVDLTEGQEQLVLGIPVVYEGWEDLPDAPGYTDKYRIANEEIGGVTRFDRFGQRSVHEPAIKRGLLYDLYLAPISSSGENSYTLNKDTPTQIEGGLVLTFLELGITGEDENHSAHNIYAVLEAELDGATELVQAMMEPKDGGFEAVETMAFAKFTISLIAVSNDQEAVMLLAHDIDCVDHSTEQMTVEFSKKPLINLVWLGTIIISVGTIWAAVRRRGKLH